MAVHIQTFTFLFFRYAQANNHICQLEAHEGYYARPDDGQATAEQLHPNLMAHAVHTEHIARVIHAQPFLQRGHTPDTCQATGQTDNQCAADADIATGWRDGNQTGDEARRRTQQ